MAVSRGNTVNVDWTLNENALTTSLVCTLPSAMAAGKVLVAHVVGVIATLGLPGTGSWQWAAGSPVGASNTVLSGLAYTTDPAAGLTFTQGTADKMMVILTVYSGENPLTVVDVTPTTNNVTTQSMTLTGITTVTDGDMLISGCGINASTITTITQPSGWNLIARNTSGTGKGGGYADLGQAVQGATGNQIWTNSAVAGTQQVGYLAAIRAAASSAGSPGAQMISIPRLSSLRRLAPTPMLLARNVAHEFAAVAAPQAATGASAADGRATTAASGVKGGANPAAATQHTTTSAAVTKQGAGAGAAVQRAATAAAGVKNATAVGRAEQHTQTVAAKAAPNGAAVAAGRAVTASAGGKGGVGAGLSVQRSASASSVRKGGVGTASPIQHSSTVSADVKGGVGGGLAVQHSSTVDAGVKAATTGAGVAVTRSNTRATTAVQIGGAAAAVTRSVTVSAGKRGTAGVAAASVRPVTVGAGKAARLAGAAVVTRAVTAVSIIHGGVGAARVQAHSETVATFSPAYVAALVDVGGSSGWAGAPDRDAASGALTDSSAGTGSVPDVGSAGGSSPDQGSAAGALVG